MEDSDGVDEAEAAAEYQRTRVTEMLDQMDNMRGTSTPEEWLSELIEVRPRLLKWVDTANPEIEGWINLSHVNIVNIGDDGALVLKIGDAIIQTSDQNTIDRFFNEWEVV